MYSAILFAVLFNKIFCSLQYQLFYSSISVVFLVNIGCCSHQYPCLYASIYLSILVAVVLNISCYTCQYQLLNSSTLVPVLVNIVCCTINISCFTSQYWYLAMCPGYLHFNTPRVGQSLFYSSSKKWATQVPNIFTIIYFANLHFYQFSCIF